MAIKPQSNEAFLREVDEELRRDQLASFWSRYGLALIVAIVAALALFGGWLYYQHHREQVAGAEGERLADAYRALGEEKPAAAQPILASLASSDRPGNRAAALTTQADLLLEKKGTPAPLQPSSRQLPATGRSASRFATWPWSVRPLPSSMRCGRRSWSSGCARSR